MRFGNTDPGAADIAASAPLRVLAIDGYAVNGAAWLVDRLVRIPAGGRADLEVVPTDAPVRVGNLSGPSLLVGPPGSPAALSGSVRFDPLQ